MSGRQTLLAALAGVVVVGTVTGVVLTTGDEVVPATTIAAEDVTEPTEAVITTAQPAASGVGDDTDTAEESCIPDPGTEVAASGHIEGYDPEEEDTMGSAAKVRFRLDAPGNQNLILFRLIHIEGNDLQGWQEVGGVEESELTFDPATSRLSGWFNLSNDLGATGFENPERTEVNLVYEAGRVSGTLTHPEMTFTIDLLAEEAARDFFDDPSCYPTPTEEPGQ